MTRRQMLPSRERFIPLHRCPVWHHGHFCIQSNAVIGDKQKCYFSVAQVAEQQGGQQAGSKAFLSLPLYKNLSSAPTAPPVVFSGLIDTFLPCAALTQPLSLPDRLVLFTIHTTAQLVVNCTFQERLAPQPCRSSQTLHARRRAGQGWSMSTSTTWS